MINSRKKIAVLICSNVIGGHEFQAKKLAEDLSIQANVTVFVNKLEHIDFFRADGYETVALTGKLLQKGWIGRQLLSGLSDRHSLRKELASFEQVVVCAGAVEASVRVGVSLFRKLPTILYLPSFYDRIPLWGCALGGVYNSILAMALKFFDRILVINRIQGKIIGTRAHRPVLVLPNVIRTVQKAEEGHEPKLVYVGRIDQQKRLTELIEWLDFKTNPFHKFLVIGDGPEKDAALAQSRNMSFLQVDFAGWLRPEEQDKKISDKDVLLLNSSIEGEPLVLREAQARGMRVLVRNILGVRGVTKKSERFDSQAELVQQLVKISNKPVPPYRTQVAIHGQRARTINYLASKSA